MDLVLESLQNNEENEEDDYDSYFLQPASSPYNIAEKVQQANIDLFSDVRQTVMEKTCRVTFREELTSYEPETFLTDDDVNSIESDPPEADLEPNEPSQILEYKSSNVINLNIFDIDEDEEDDEAVIEEIIPEECDTPNIVDNNVFLGNCSDGNQSLKSQISSEKCVVETTRRKKTRKKSGEFKLPQTQHVNCRNHCLERLDFDLSMSIKKLEIHEKPAKCPLLKLQSRKCCDENRLKNPTNLPCYNGFRSEYGLTSAELERRKHRRQIIKVKEQKRQELILEYKNRKNQQNEEVFCQWLKEVARRKTYKQKINMEKHPGKQCFSPNVISLPTRLAEKANERPKTANEFVPRQQAKRTKRPHTSPACVFIEVPQKLLERGVQFGDLLVTNADYSSKKMHILTVST